MHGSHQNLRILSKRVFFVALGTGQERPAKKVLGRSNGNPKRGFKEVSRHKKQQLKLEVSMIWVNSRTKPPVGHLKMVVLLSGNPSKILARTIAGVPYF